MGNGPAHSVSFAPESSKPLPIIGVWRGRAQGGAHDHAQDASPCLSADAGALGGRRERESNRDGSPRNLDSQAFDADAIGIFPVQPGWTVLDGG